MTTLTKGQQDILQIHLQARFEVLSQALALRVKYDYEYQMPPSADGLVMAHEICMLSEFLRNPDPAKWDDLPREIVRVMHRPYVQEALK